MTRGAAGIPESIPICFTIALGLPWQVYPWRVHYGTFNVTWAEALAARVSSRLAESGRPAVRVLTAALVADVLFTAIWARITSAGRNPIGRVDLEAEAV
jgi:hypothetical protein